MIQRIVLILFLFLARLVGVGQEINATVTVLSPNIQMTNKQVFTTMETAIRDFVNSFQWTNLEYEVEERIECAFVITINNYGGGTTFGGNLQVQYSRPVFNSDYNSPVFNYIDNDIGFTYVENQPLDYQPNNHISNLTSILAFYCNLIIGLDRESMQQGAGTPFFTQIQNIVTAAQSDGGASGWRSFDGNKSRFWLSDNLNSPAFQPIVDALYYYHRQGMDLMHDPANQQNAKTTMRDAIMGIQDVFQKRPNALLINTFFDAKSDEIVAVFSDGPQVDIQNMVNALKQMDAGRTDKYERLEK
jgi:hypothetical protein